VKPTTVTPVSALPSGATTLPLRGCAGCSVRWSAGDPARSFGLMNDRALYLLTPRTLCSPSPTAVRSLWPSSRLIPSLTRVANSFSSTVATAYVSRGEAATHTTPGPGKTTKRYDPSGWTMDEDAATSGPFVIRELWGLGKSG